VIKVGGASEMEVKEKKDRVEDALNATRAAVEEGIVPGGGVALLRAKKAVGRIRDENSDVQAGINIVLKALEAPIRQIAENAAWKARSWSARSWSTSPRPTDSTPQEEIYVDMVEAGIIDPAKVVRTALQDAGFRRGPAGDHRSHGRRTAEGCGGRPCRVGGGMGGNGRHDVSRPLHSRTQRARLRPRPFSLRRTGNIRRDAVRVILCHNFRRESSMDQRIIDLYDRFTHGGIDRREFIDRLAKLAGSSAAALALLPLLQNDYARAAIIAPDDARLAIDTVSYSAAGTRSTAIWRGSSPRANGRRSSCCTKIAASIRTSRTSRGASRSKASSALVWTCYRRLAARRRTRTKRAT